MKNNRKKRSKNLKMRTKKPIKTKKINQHIASGFCAHSEYAYGDIKNPIKLYRGKKTGEKLCNYLENEAKRLYNMFPNNKKMDKLNDDEQKSHDEARNCYMCNGEFVEWDESKKDDKDFKKKFKNGRKVRDHCHYTGKYRGAAHSKCNLAYQLPKHIPVVFHNLSKYDSKHFIKDLAKKFGESGITVIAKNGEEYISFSVKVVVGSYIDKKGKSRNKTVELRFIDSLRFMPSSLDKLAAGLDDDDFKNLRKEFPDDKTFKLLRKKGVYPYEYIDSLKRFKETKLPNKDKFYSKLTKSGITDEMYEHAKNVWDAMEIKNMGEYHDIYLKTDVLLLADVFRNFRNTCLKNYDLDPAYFLTAPGLAWQACLKYTGVKLELLSDPNMVLMFEKGTRGGIVQAIKRYAEANNKYMGDKFDIKKLISYLMYLDENNLYGNPMSGKLPFGGFKWYKDFDASETDTSKLAEFISRKASEENKGYLLEVDVGYPKKLHDKHNDLPFLPEKMPIGKVDKLVPNLNDKEKYVVHINTLDQALKHGLILKKIHRIIQFDQKDWMKKYIEKNTELRKVAKNDFEKDFFKLMNNSVFGKTMENVRKHRNIKLVTNRKEFNKLVMKPVFNGSKKFGDDFFACEIKKTSVLMNKPIYLGQAILDISKTIMYEFHYDFMLPKYGDKVELCYMDTDSFVYHIKTEDVYKDFAPHVKKHFDTSNYSKDCGLPIEIGMNKKKLGMMKDELGGKIMTHFVTLGNKVYSYKTLSGDEVKKCKGTNKHVVDKELEYSDYTKSLFDNVIINRKNPRISTHNHNLYTIETDKIALNPNDDKRIICSNGINTLARGHYKIPLSA